MRKKVVISLGGSLIVPDRIDIQYLGDFSKIIRKYIDKYSFFIVAGGGKTARDYINAASLIVQTNSEDKDWLGIHATKLNAHLLRTIFQDIACPRIIDSVKELREEHQITIAAGYRPGYSTDNVAVQIAVSQKVKRIINLTNTDYVYDKDPQVYTNARKIEQIYWKEFCNLVGDKWVPGLNAPFDPVASREAKKHKLKVVISDGKDLENLEAIILDGSYKGTTIF